MKKNLFKSILLMMPVLFLPMIVFAARDVGGIIGDIEAAFITVGGSIVVIGWIVTGILYLTAAGSPDKLGTAKKSLIACVIGTALIILALGAEETITALLGQGG